MKKILIFWFLLNFLIINCFASKKKVIATIKSIASSNKNINISKISFHRNNQISIKGRLNFKWASIYTDASELITSKEAKTLQQFLSDLYKNPGFDTVKLKTFSYKTKKEKIFLNFLITCRKLKENDTYKKDLEKIAASVTNISIINSYFKKKDEIVIKVCSYYISTKYIQKFLVKLGYSAKFDDVRLRLGNKIKKGQNHFWKAEIHCLKGNKLSKLKKQMNNLVKKIDTLVLEKVYKDTDDNIVTITGKVDFSKKVTAVKKALKNKFHYPEIKIETLKKENKLWSFEIICSLPAQKPEK